VGRKTEARRRRDPQTRQAVLEAQRRSYHNGGKDRAKEYLKRLKRDNFFVWKARRSYVWLTAAELKTLWVRQHGRCALTGRALDDTAELDHVVPRSRGGENSFKNARWLCREANQAKRDLLDTEFLGLCREVIAYATWIGREALAEIKRGEAAA
jgi:5-methylcytosine-specific restriction endonuclease McrA